MEHPAPAFEVTAADTEASPAADTSDTASAATSAVSTTDSDDDSGNGLGHRRPRRRAARPRARRRRHWPAPGAHVTHRLLAALGLCAAAVALVWLTGAPAAAHASLLSTDPADGSVAATTPQQVVFTFNEPVRLDDGAVHAFKPDGSDWKVTAEATDNRVVVTPAGGSRQRHRRRGVGSDLR